MIRKRHLLPVAVLALAACQQPAQAGTSTTQASTAQRCPASTFDAFFKRFSNDIAIQKTYVAATVQSDSVDPNAEPEPAPVHKKLAKEDILFPVLPTIAKQASMGLRVTTAHKSAEDIAVQVTKPDTDDQKTFHFRPERNCWTLFRIEDDSL